MPGNYSGTPREIYSKDEMEKKSIDLLDNVQSFSNNVYPRMKSLLDRLADKGDDLDSTLKQDANDIINEILSSPCFNKAKFDFLNSQSLDKTTQAQHDLNNFSSGLFGIVELLREDLGTLEDIKTVYDNWSGFAMALEDVLLHEQKLETKEEQVNQRPLDLVFLMAGINQLITSGAVGGRVKKLFGQQKLPDLSGILKTDEQIMTQPAVVSNFLFNDFRNASSDNGEEKKASQLNFDVVRDDNELIFRVIDNGRGMSAQQLDPNNPKYIFGKGEQSSGSGSTGIGIAEAPERLNQFANAQLRVWSRPKGDMNAPYNTFPPDSGINIPVLEMKESDPNNPAASVVSTIFELRLPITKKAA